MAASGRASARPSDAGRHRLKGVGARRPQIASKAPPPIRCRSLLRFPDRLWKRAACHSETEKQLAKAGNGFIRLFISVVGCTRGMLAVRLLCCSGMR